VLRELARWKPHLASLKNLPFPQIHRPDPRKMASICTLFSILRASAKKDDLRVHFPRRSPQTAFSCEFRFSSSKPSSLVRFFEAKAIRPGMSSTLIAAFLSFARSDLAELVRSTRARMRARALSILTFRCFYTFTLRIR
jgi:hypothetical protein